jgi:hypothetical protein
MSTRANIVIKKTTNNDKVKYYQLYHHCDGYFEGVGCDLQNIMNKVMEESADNRKDILSSPLSLAVHISEYDESFEIEGEHLNLHGDIEYLYVIDINAQTITCYSVFMQGIDRLSDEEYVNGTANKVIIDKNRGVRRLGEAYVNTAKFTDKWLSYDDDKFENWSTSDLYQHVEEDATVIQILSKLEDELDEEAFRKVLIAISEDIEEEVQ